MSDVPVGIAHERVAEFTQRIQAIRSSLHRVIVGDRDEVSLVCDKGAPFAIIIHDHAQVLLTRHNGRRSSFARRSQSAASIRPTAPGRSP